ncbi:hypothetical protein [Kytococcus sedentarius]|uniref:hypothetical protein n=1 Tax=Kytococcus sedentarius TaxID=1276 RepID=UPI0035BC7DB9
MARRELSLTTAALVGCGALLMPAAASADEAVEHRITFSEPDDRGRIAFTLEVEGWLGPHVEGEMPEYSISAKRPGESHFHHAIGTPSAEELVCVAGADPLESTVATPYGPEAGLTEEFDGLYVIGTYCDGSEDGAEVLGVLERTEDGSWEATDGPIEVVEAPGPIVDTGRTAHEGSWSLAAAVLGGLALAGTGGALVARGRRA